MKMKQLKVKEAIIALIQASSEKGTQPSQELQKQFGLSRQQVSRYLTDLVKQGIITSHGTGRGVNYTLVKDTGKNLLSSGELSLDQLSQLGEEKVFQTWVQHSIQAYPKNIKSIIHHGFTELTNNVIDHADANKFWFKIFDDHIRNKLIMEIHDDGVGVFRRNQIAFACRNLFEAVVETAKGKRTSQPKKHAGEGLFFTSRLFDYFRLQANGIEWLYLSAIDDWSIATIEDIKGSHIITMIDKASLKKPEDIFVNYTDEEFQFSKNALFIVEPLTIQAQEEHVSRSEAKRLLMGAEKFKHIIIDFKNTTRIGQGFADEIFRIFQQKHPQLTIETRNMNKAVEAMVKHILLHKEQKL